MLLKLEVLIAATLATGCLFTTSLHAVSFIGLHHSNMTTVISWAHVWPASSSMNTMQDFCYSYLTFDVLRAIQRIRFILKINMFVMV